MRGSGPDDGVAKSGRRAAERPGYRDTNAEIHRRWVAAQEEVTAAEASGDPDRLRIAQSQLEAVGSEFYTANRGLAMSVAKSFVIAGDEHGDDYVNAASLGLWEAFRKWDPSKGVTFGTFSRQFIKGRLVRTVRAAEYGYISQTDFNRRKEVREMQARLARSLDRAPTHEEIAKELGITTHAVSRALAPREASLDVPVGDGERTLGDIVGASEDTIGSLELEQNTMMDRLLDELNELELWLVATRGELLGTPPQSLVEIADEIGVGREIARRAEAKAKARLTHTKLAMVLGRCPSAEELADTLGVETEKAAKMLKPTWGDLHARWRRAAYALSYVREGTDYETCNERRAWLDRVGEEVIAHGAELISEAATCYTIATSDSNAPSTIGAETAADELWNAFRSWDPDQDPQFPAWVRRHWNRLFVRTAALESDPVTADEIAEAAPGLWSRIKRSVRDLPVDTTVE